MRKVLVFGTAFAATCLTTAATLPASATSLASAPLDPVSPQPSATADPGLPAEPPVQSPAPGTEQPIAPGPPSGTPGDPGTTVPGAPGAPPEPEIVSAQAVMVTPPAPAQRTYSYGEHPRQRVDAYWHGGETRRPGILLLHGGYWQNGGRASWKYYARRLAARGYVVFASDYRLTHSAGWPAQRNDTLTALNYIKKNADRWRLDPDRMVVLGSSAGGHLATMLGTYGDGSARVRGVVALSPVNAPYLAYQDGARPDATAPRQRLREAVVRLVRCTPAGSGDACWNKLEDASSLTHASAGDVPMLLMHSRDEFVPVTHSTGLADNLRQAGVRATVRTRPGDAHGGEMLADERDYDEIVTWIDQVAGR